MYEKLREYLQHKPGCHALLIPKTATRTPLRCTCGLEAMTDADLRDQIRTLRAELLRRQQARATMRYRKAK